MKKRINHHSQVMNVSFKGIWLLPLFLLGLSGCGGGPGGGGTDGGTVVNTFELPRDEVALTLWCPNVGIAKEECVLFDPQNPFARSVVTDDTKWDLQTAIGNAEASEGVTFLKARYYLWATAQAKNPTGENQFYTAESLHKLHQKTLGELARSQAQKAYRSVLDNYFDSLTFSANGQTSFNLRDWTGERLVEPPNGLPQLFGTSAVADAAVGEWGYIYDTANNTIAKKVTD